MADSLVLTRRVRVRAELKVWFELLTLFHLASEVGMELPAELYRFGVELAGALFAQMGLSCEICRCTAARPCPGGCNWDPSFALQGVPRCTRCGTGPRILRPGDPDFDGALALMRGNPRRPSA
jgi:hypothetical protein